MASISEASVAVDRVGTWRSIWGVCLVLCPLSYTSLAAIRFSPLPGAFAALCLALSLAATIPPAQRRRPRLSVGEGALALTGGGVIVGLVGHSLADLARLDAVLLSVASAVQIAFVWVFVPWLTCDLGGTEHDPRTSLHAGPHAAASPRASLGFIIFLSFVLFGLGALWSRGEPWVPGPLPWLAALSLLVCGAMLLERLSFLGRSARDGNLSVPPRARRHWTAIAILILLFCALLAGLGPYHAAAPVSTERTGSAPLTPPAWPSLASRPHPLEAATAAVVEAVAVLRALPRGAIPVFLLLLLLLVAVILVWLFQRSRAATWLLWVVSWLIAKALAVWRRLQLLFERTLAPGSVASSEEQPRPAWVADPLFDIFDHPEVLGALSPREIVLRTYHLFLNVAEMLGCGRQHSQTPLEYARALGIGEGAPRTALERLTWGYIAVMYGEAARSMPSPQAVHEAWRRVFATLTGRFSAEDLALRRKAYLSQRMFL